MQNMTSTLGRFAVIVASALTLGSCSRAEYAFLPKSASYLGTATAAPKVRQTAPVAATAATPTQAVVASPVEAPAVAPEITVATAPVATAPVAAAPATPVAVATPEVAPAAAEVATTTTATPAAAPKLNLVQRLALAKVTKKLNKLAASAPQIKQKDATAHTARINGNLRTGLILLLIGLIVGIFSNIIGLIIALIGVIFIVLWLLDEL